MPNHEGPPPGAMPPDPAGPTQPIRPSQGGSEPIPERVRQPIVVPRQETTIAGLPRAFAVAAIVALAVALVVGILIGRSLGGGDEAAEGAASGGRGGCGKALSLSLQVLELQEQALANRTQAAQAVAIGDEGQVQELNTVLESLGPAIQAAQAELGTAVEKCRSGRGGRGKGGQGKGGKSQQGSG